MRSIFHSAVTLFCGIVLFSVTEARATNAILTTVPAGEYVFTGEIKPDVLLKIESVPLQNARGIERLEELRAQSYACVRLSSQVARCAKLIADAPWPEAALAAERARHEAVGRVQIGMAKGDPVPVHVGSAIEEWMSPQSLAFGPITEPALRIVVVGKLVKIKAGVASQGTSTEFRFDPGTKTLSSQSEVAVTRGAVVERYSGFAVHRWERSL